VKQYVFLHSRPPHEDVDKPRLAAGGASGNQLVVSHGINQIAIPELLPAEKAWGHAIDLNRFVRKSERPPKGDLSFFPAPMNECNAANIRYSNRNCAPFQHLHQSL
jgi:hypothetical protein